MADNPIWIAQAGSQRLYLSCPVFECLLHGTRGSAKTDGLLMDFAQHCEQGYGRAWRGILFRNSYPQLEEVIAKVNKWFYPIFSHFEYNRSGHVCRWATGEELYLRHMDRVDDYWKYHGHEYPWIGWDELTNWATPDCYERMKSCCRSPHPTVPRKYRATTNPYGKGHNWVKAYFIDIGPPGTIHGEVTEIDGRKLTLERTHIKGHYAENRALMDSEPTYAAKIAAGRDPMITRAWLEGDWDIVAGGMFDDVWRPREHIVTPFAIPKSWTVFRAFDWGSSKPSSVGWWAESDGTGVNGFGPGAVRGDLIRIDELYTWNGRPNEGNRMLARDIARDVLRKDKLQPLKVDAGPADSSIFDSDRGTSIADDMASAGVHWLKADKKPGSRQIGWERMRQRLAAATQRPREEPGLWVFETCRHFIRTIPVLPRDENKPDDVDTDSEDHIADETRYAVMRRQLKAQIKAVRL